MMRIVKTAQERKNEILDAAERLFAQKGYDGTSTNDILTAVGIARGTLYHHFKSKEEIMDALIDRINTRLIEGARKISMDQSIPVIERLIRVIMALNISNGGASSEAVMEHIHKPQNALMHQKIQKVIINDVTPILADIIREGIEQGLFDTPYPYECMEMLVAYASAVFDEDTVSMTEEQFLTRVQALLFNAERLLGAESGSMMAVMQVFSNNGATEGHA